MMSKKATAKGATAKKATASKSTAKVAAKKASAPSQPERAPGRRAATPSGRASTLTAPGRSGGTDLSRVDDDEIARPREGEVLEVIHGEVSVSYRVRWADGHETLIAPKVGTARIPPGNEEGLSGPTLVDR